MFPLPAILAYIDPGSGSLLLQMIIAGAIGVITFFRHTIFGFFKRSKPKPKDPAKREE